MTDNTPETPGSSAQTALAVGIGAVAALVRRRTR